MKKQFLLLCIVGSFVATQSEIQGIQPAQKPSLISKIMNQLGIGKNITAGAQSTSTSTSSDSSLKPIGTTITLARTTGPTTYGVDASGNLIVKDAQNNWTIVNQNDPNNKKVINSLLEKLPFTSVATSPVPTQTSTTASSQTQPPSLIATNPANQEALDQAVANLKSTQAILNDPTSTAVQKAKAQTQATTMQKNIDRLTGKNTPALDASKQLVIDKANALINEIGNAANGPSHDRNNDLFRAKTQSEQNIIDAQKATTQQEIEAVKAAHNNVVNNYYKVGTNQGEGVGKYNLGDQGTKSTFAKYHTLLIK